MVDILVRNVDEDIARRLKEKAKAKGASVNETARQAIDEVLPQMEAAVEQTKTDVKWGD